MRINPPKAIVDEKEPFKHALFGRESFAKSLAILLQNVSENLVIFVNAPWGAGKTTFAEMWQAHLRQQGFETIYFDAYAADYFEDPFVCFSAEILDFIDKQPDGKELAERREFKQTAIEVGKRLAGLAAKVGLRAATMGAFESSDLEDLKDIGSGIAEGVAEIGEDFIKKKLENYGIEKDALKKFKESLAKVAAKVRAQQGFPLTIIVDELDRCRPDFALALLERIKHLFDVEGMAFILLVNRSQIESYIQNAYSNADSSAYLLKFGSLFVDLPCQEPFFSYLYQPGRKEFCHRLAGHFDLSKCVPNCGFLITCTEVFAAHLDLTLREIEKVFTVMTLYYGSVPQNQFAHPFLVSMLSVLKIKRPLLYDLLRKGSISLQQFLEQSGFNEMKINPNTELSLDWVRSVIEYCLMSDADIERTEENRRKQITQAGSWVGRDRKMAIPLLCARLDQFTVSPR